METIIHKYFKIQLSLKHSQQRFQLAIDSVEFYPTSRSNDTLWFTLIAGFVVKWELLYIAFDTGDCSRISNITLLKK